MSKTTTSLWYSVWTVSLLMALSIAAVMMVNLPTAAYAKPTDDKTSLRSRYALRGVQIASLGNASRDGLSGGSVRWTASAGCLNSTLRRVVGAVAATFGPVTVNSTCRSVRHNAAVGGAHRSHHIGGNAVDFSVKGNVRAVHAYLSNQRSVGGLKYYGSHFHIDTGPRRKW
jgi:uncharacterized protein YcbK (DUF882 family)